MLQKEKKTSRATSTNICTKNNQTSSLQRHQSLRRRRRNKRHRNSPAKQTGIKLHITRQLKHSWRRSFRKKSQRSMMMWKYRSWTSGSASWNSRWLHSSLRSKNAPRPSWTYRTKSTRKKASKLKKWNLSRRGATPSSNNRKATCCGNTPRVTRLRG